MTSRLWPMVNSSASAGNYNRNQTRFNLPEGTIRIALLQHPNKDQRITNRRAAYPVRNEKLIYDSDRGDIAFTFTDVINTTEKVVNIDEEPGLSLAMTDVQGLGNTETGEEDAIRELEHKLIPLGIVGRPYNAPDNDEQGFTADIHGVVTISNNGPDDIESGDLLIACFPPRSDYKYTDTRQKTLDGKKPLIYRPLKQNALDSIAKDVEIAEANEHLRVSLDRNPAESKFEETAIQYADGHILSFIHQLNQLVQDKKDWIEDFVRDNDVGLLLARMQTERKQTIAALCEKEKYLRFKKKLAEEIKGVGARDPDVRNIDETDLTERFVDNIPGMTILESVVSPMVEWFSYWRRRIVAVALSSGKSGQDVTVCVEKY